MRGLPPDVSYFLDCSASLMDMSGDAYEILKDYHPNTTAMIDAYDRVERPKDIPWGDALRFHANYLQTEALKIYPDLPLEDRIWIAARSLTLMSNLFDEYGTHSARSLVKEGFSRLPRSPKNKEFSKMLYRKNILVGNANRSFEILNGFAPMFVSEVCKDVSDRKAVEWREYRNSLREAVQQSEPYQHDIEEQESVKKLIQQRKLNERKIIKRSIKIAQKLIGTEPTRVFIGGDAIRFEGRYAIYELVKTNYGVLGGHGNSSLKLFDKDTKEHLCNICIYTPGVPILDHVASIAMHIKNDMKF